MPPDSHLALHHCLANEKEAVDLALLRVRGFWDGLNPGAISKSITHPGMIFFCQV